MLATLARIALLISLAPVLSGCLERDKLAQVPDAENQLFTSDGRYIVTGGTGAFEIKRNGTNYVAEPIASDTGTCNHTGLAQIGSWVFTACQHRPLFGSANNHLLAAKLVAGQPLRFVQVERSSTDPLDAMAIPNGLAVTPDGKLLIADFNLFGSAGVARVSLDFGGAKPRVVNFEANWLNWQHGIHHPNGVRVNGSELFVSDLGSVRRFKFDAAGRVPLTLPTPSGGSVKNEVLVFQAATIVDDILPVCGGVAITDFAGGQLIYMAPNGTDGNGMPRYRLGRASGLASLQSPSSVLVGRAPLFSGKDVLVTEKGILLEMWSDIGNKLSRVKASVDLSDAAGCAQLNS